MGGTILRLNYNKPGAIWERVFQYGDYVCQVAAEQKELCGRPLGLDFDLEGRLVVADAFRGVYKIDTETGKMDVSDNNSK